MSKGNKYFNGNKGRVWMNDINYAECYKAEAKRTNSYEEIPDPEGNGTVQVPMGYSIEGSLAMKKVGNEAILQQLKADKNNELDISIVIKEENSSTGIVERVKYTGITFDEIPLSQFEKRSVTEIELKFKAVDYEIL